MDNITIEVKGTILTLTVDLARVGTPSASGKTDVVASTRGNAQVPGYPQVRVGMNVFRYREDK